jgi:hypothetical protein
MSLPPTVIRPYESEPLVLVHTTLSAPEAIGKTSKAITALIVMLRRIEVI